MPPKVRALRAGPIASFFHRIKQASGPRIVLIISLTWLLWKIVEEPPDCSLLPDIRTFEPCGYSDAELLKILQEDHGFTPGSPRYFYSGQWVQFVTLEYRMSMWTPEVKSSADAPPCILVSVQGSAPCFNTSCLLPFYLRPRSSDLQSLKSIFEFHPSQFAFMKEGLLSLRGRVSSVLDAGANIGITSVALAVMFPSARVLAVEPSEDNFPLLRLNSHAFPNIVPLRAALWSRSGLSLVVHSDPRMAGFWALMTSEAEEVPKKAEAFGRAPSVTIPLLSEYFGIEKFDFLKMDVEGSEREVFRNLSSSWVSGLQVAMVSMHDQLRLGSEDAVRSAFSLDNFLLQFGPAHYIYTNRSLFNSFSENPVELR